MNAPLPKAYAFLAAEPGPLMLHKALQYYGVRETPGPADNAVIMAWASMLGDGVSRIYAHDSVPWCGLFMAHVAQAAGKPLPASPLWARAWASWGEKSPRPALGDVLVFVRPGGGHVGLYVGEDATHYHVLGGNQGDAVSFVRLSKNGRAVRCIAVRRLYRTGVPANVRPIRITARGPVNISLA